MNTLTSPLLRTLEHTLTSVFMSDIQEENRPINSRLNSTRLKAALLMKSAFHPSMAQVLLKCRDTLTPDGSRYILKPFVTRYKSAEMEATKTNAEVDSRAAATNALICACWAADIDLAKWILEDMHELIDINTPLEDMSIIEWTVDIMGWCSEREYLDEAIDVCRLLVSHYGPELNANSSSFLRSCIRGGYADMVAYLYQTYGRDLVIDRHSGNILKCLAVGGEDEVAKLYLGQYQDRLSLYKDVLKPAVRYASTQLFTSVLNMFQSRITPEDINKVFGMLGAEVTVTDRKAKVDHTLDMWMSELTPQTIESCLANCWNHSTKDRDNSASATGQMIVEKHIDVIANQWLGIAMVVCCWPPNHELLGTVIDKSLGTIQQNPKYLEHILFECCERAYTDTFALILAKVGTCIYARSFELWAEVSNQTAITMLFEVGAASTELIECIPENLGVACMRGDTELARLIIKLAGDLISDFNYYAAFISACSFARTDTIRMLAVTLPCIRSKLDGNLDLSNMSPDIIRLLNELFDLGIDPEKGGWPMFRRLYSDHTVTYPDVPEVRYTLRPPVV